MKTIYKMISQGKVIGTKELKSDISRRRLSSIEDRESLKYGAYVFLRKENENSVTQQATFQA